MGRGLCRRWRKHGRMLTRQGQVKMIVNSLKDGWEIIFQRSHANLAAILVAAWRKQDHVPRWTELIIATAQHDDQEMFWSQATHLTEIGAPMDFMQSDLDSN